MSQEKRKYSRTDCLFDISILVDGVAIPGKVLDISLNGVMIKAHLGCRVDQFVDLEIIPGKSRELDPIRATARITRITADRVGMHFEVMELGSYLRLDNALKRLNTKTSVITRSMIML